MAARVVQASPRLVHTRIRLERGEPSFLHDPHSVRGQSRTTLCAAPCRRTGSTSTFPTTHVRQGRLDLLPAGEVNGKPRLGRPWKGNTRFKPSVTKDSQRFIRVHKPRHDLGPYGAPPTTAPNHGSRPPTALSRSASRRMFNPAPERLRRRTNPDKAPLNPLLLIKTDSTAGPINVSAVGSTQPSSLTPTAAMCSSARQRVRRVHSQPRPPHSPGATSSSTATSTCRRSARCPVGLARRHGVRPWTYALSADARRDPSEILAGVSVCPTGSSVRP